MTNQQVADRMLAGWHAAQAGHAYDFNQDAAWQRGWLDWHDAHD